MEHTVEISEIFGAPPKWVGDFLRENKRFKNDNATLSSKNSILQEQINLSSHKHFGADTEVVKYSTTVQTSTDILATNTPAKLRQKALLLKHATC